MRTIESILLVDDDKDDQYFFYTALEEVNPGIKLSAAGEGNEALEKIRISKPDLILLDLVMPGMNGYSFLQTIKADKSLRNIPVIVYTSDLSIFGEKEVLRLGAEDVIIKSVTYEGTVKIIREILGENTLKESA